jgi:hypothetical protein
VKRSTMPTGMDMSRIFVTGLPCSAAPHLYQVSSVKPTFTVTCQSAIQESTSSGAGKWPNKAYYSCRTALKSWTGRNGASMKPSERVVTQATQPLNEPIASTAALDVDEYDWGE